MGYLVVTSSLRVLFKITKLQKKNQKKTKHFVSELIISHHMKVHQPSEVRVVNDSRVGLAVELFKVGRQPFR